MTTYDAYHVPTRRERVMLTDWRHVPTGAKRRVEIRYGDPCGNGHNRLTLRADGPREWIAQTWPELAHLVKWDGVGTDGPMHYLANTLWHSGQTRAEAEAKSARIEGVALMQPDPDRRAALMREARSLRERANGMPAGVTAEELASAQRCACAPGASWVQLQSRAWLKERLPGLVAEFKRDVGRLLAAVDAGTPPWDRSGEEAERSTDSDLRRFRVGGELFSCDPEDARELGAGVVEIETEEGYTWILAEDEAAAGAVARAYWEDMAKHDPEEFACLVGADTLARWCLGQSAGPGSVQVRSLEEWLQLVASAPAEELARWDGEERDVQRVGKLSSDLGFTPTLAYRAG